MAVKAIVVLGYPVGRTGRVKPVCARRVRKAVDIFSGGSYGLVVFSGRWWFRFRTPPRKTEAAAMRDYAVSIGLPRSKALQEARSRDTFENAYFTKLLLERRGCRDITLVTSEYQVPRARFIFRTVFGPGYRIRFVGVPSGLSGERLSYKMRVERFSTYVLRNAMRGRVKVGDDRSLRSFMEMRRLTYSGRIRQDPEERRLLERLASMRKRDMQF